MKELCQFVLNAKMKLKKSMIVITQTIWITAKSAILNCITILQKEKHHEDANPRLSILPRMLH